jgi:signal transduction histidine kinase
MVDLSVLVVDADVENRRLVKRTLRNFSYQPIDIDDQFRLAMEMASTWNQGQRLLLKNPPDILILGDNLPDEDAPVILRLLSELPTRPGIIQMVASPDTDQAIRMIRSGATSLVFLPLDGDELMQEVLKAAKQAIINRQARSHAEEKKQLRFQFISVIAHEMKSPLAAVEGYLNMMVEKLAGPDIQNYQQMVDRSLSRIDGMKKMISDLLDLTRIESGQKVRQLQLLNLTEIAHEAVENHIPMAQQNQVKISLLAPESLPFTADRSEIEIILSNLISNAIKYNVPKGQVDLSVQRQEGQLVISCRDTGIGMDDLEQKKLFGEFVRIKNQKTKNILGSGLGLSIMRKLVDLYGGKITLQSAPDKGTLFQIRMPLN